MVEFKKSELFVGLVLVLGTLALNSGWAAAPLEFKFKGKLKSNYSLESLQKLVSSESVSVLEEHESSQEKKYSAISFVKLLNAIYGDELKAADEVVFTCADGYQPSIPLSKFQKHTAWLAHERLDKSPFHFKDAKDGKQIEYGPYYLVWNNLKDPILKLESNEDWPYQVVSVDLILFATRFGSLAPPGNVSDIVKRGFAVYRKQCLQCHTLNGEGGDKGIELNYPVNVTEYFKQEFFKRWLKSPQSIRFNATMPAVNPAYPDRDKMVDEIYAYLKAMKGRKVPPKR